MESGSFSPHIYNSAKKQTKGGGGGGGEKVFLILYCIVDIANIRVAKVNPKLVLKLKIALGHVTLFSQKVNQIPIK